MPFMRGSDPIISPPSATPAEIRRAIFGQFSPAEETPLTQYVEEVIRLAPLVGFDPVKVVAQSHVETSGWGRMSATAPGAVAWKLRNNPASMGITSTGKRGEPDVDRMLSWANGTDAARGQIVHLAVYVYGALLGPYEHLKDYRWLDPRFEAVIDAGWSGTVTTLNDLGGKWAADTKYGATIARRANDLFGWTEEAPTVTTSLVPVEHNQIQPGAPNYPGAKLDTSQGWIGITVHQTGDERAGSDARAQGNYVHTAEAQQRQVAEHLVVDQFRIVQTLVLDRVGWAAADGCDDIATDVGCFRTIAIEGCVNAGANYRQTLLNYAELIARLVAGDTAFDWGDGRAKGKVSAEHLYQHIWVAQNNPPHDCPYQIRHGIGGVTWPDFMTMVDQAIARIDGAGGTAKPTYGPIIAFVPYKVVRTLAGAISRKEASAAADRIRSYETGTSLRINASRSGQNVNGSTRWLRISSPGGPSNNAWIHDSGVSSFETQQVTPLDATAHVLPGAVDRIQPESQAEVIRQFVARTAVKIKGKATGENVHGSAIWFQLSSRGPSNNTFIHQSGIEEGVALAAK